MEMKNGSGNNRVEMSNFFRFSIPVSIIETLRLTNPVLFNYPAQLKREKGGSVGRTVNRCYVFPMACPCNYRVPSMIVRLVFIFSENNALPDKATCFRCRKLKA